VPAAITTVSAADVVTAEVVALPVELVLQFRLFAAQVPLAIPLTAPDPADPLLMSQ
jgi:hypothetical protein